VAVHQIRKCARGLIQNKPTQVNGPKIGRTREYAETQDAGEFWAKCLYSKSNKKTNKLFVRHMSNADSYAAEAAEDILSSFSSAFQTGVSKKQT